MFFILLLKDKFWDFFQAFSRLLLDDLFFIFYYRNISFLTSQRRPRGAIANIILVLVGLAAAGYLIYSYTSSHGYRYPAGQLLAPDEPVQSKLKKSDRKQWKHEDYLIKALARFEIKARVLIAERYWSDREADLSPVDLTLAWGPASDTAVLEQFDFYKLHRYYRYEWDEAGAPSGVIKAHTANMHMIGARPSINNRLKAVAHEDVVTLRGYLVRVEATDGWHWQSSMTRNDSGEGACELVWVEEVSTE